MAKPKSDYIRTDLGNYREPRAELDPKDRDFLEQRISQGLKLFEELKFFAQNWPEDVRTGATEYSEEFETAFLNDLRQWLQTTRSILNVIEQIEVKHGYRALRDADELLFAFWEAERFQKTWARPVPTMAQGLRCDSLNELESETLLKALHERTARPNVRPRRVSDTGSE